MKYAKKISGCHQTKQNKKQAGAELCQAQVKLGLIKVYLVG
jgi:hypothetical protein